MRHIQFVGIIYLILGGIFMLTNDATAQGKIKQEVEKRIKKRDMPPEALNYLNEHWLDDSRKIRFYYETDGDNSSYEAKLTRDKRRFSIEFDESGKLQDIEELISYNQIPEETRFTIDSILYLSYSKFKVRRIQRQFLPDTTDHHRLLMWHSLTAEETNNFEIEIDTQEGSAVQSYEMLFNKEGLLVQRRTIIRRSLDNFLY